MTMFALAEGAAAIALAIVAISVASAAGRCGTRLAGLAVAGFGIAAAVVSWIELGLGTWLINGLVPGRRAGTAGAVYHALNRLDGAKMFLLAAMAVAVAATALRTVSLPRWLAPLGFLLAASLAASGLGYILLAPGIASAVFSMLTASLALAALAVLAAAVVYGTDMFAAVVLRPALATLDDSALTQAAGRIHQYADRRMPLPGATSILAAAASALAAGIAGYPVQASLTGAALGALLVWLALYIRIAAPINRELTRAAATHEIPPNARGMQQRWDSIIHLRVALQTTALALLVCALAVT